MTRQAPCKRGAWRLHDDRETDMTAEVALAALDTKALRQCLGSFATGVTIITASTGTELAGVTANSFSSLSLDPPLVLWSLRKQSSSLEKFRRASHFAINILAADQSHLASRFASSTGEKFASTKWESGRGGAPVLHDVASVLECRVYREDDGGDHVIFIGEVEAFHTRDAVPLAFVHGQYALAMPHPAAQAVTGDFALGWG